MQAQPKMLPPYAVVTFINEVSPDGLPMTSEIPTAWLMKGNEFCWWPPVIDASHYIKKCTEPNEKKWKQHNIKFEQYCGEAHSEYFIFGRVLLNLPAVLCKKLKNSTHFYRVVNEQNRFIRCVPSTVKDQNPPEEVDSICTVHYFEFPRHARQSSQEGCGGGLHII